jgi:magnesium transporter
VLDQLETAFDHLEGEVVRHPSQRIVVQVLKYKKQLAAMRRNLSPLREAVASLAKSSHPLIGRGQRPYYGDAHDKVNGLYERLEAMRSILDSLETLYVSTVSQRTNEVMRILTVFSAVFMPLTFIAGVYGMNFRWMPELNYPWAYPAVIGLMLVIATSMIIWMRRKRFW